MEHKYIATYNETAFSGLGIISIEHGIDDKIIVEEFPSNRRHNLKIYYGHKGHTLFYIAISIIYRNS